MSLLFELNIHLSESVVCLVARACGLDYANILVIGKAGPVAEPNTDAATLEATVKAVVAAVSANRTACVLPGIIVSRCGLSERNCLLRRAADQ